jgi:hypothetical protein
VRIYTIILIRTKTKNDNRRKFYDLHFTIFIVLL